MTKFSRSAPSQQPEPAKGDPFKSFFRRQRTGVLLVEQEVEKGIIDVLGRDRADHLALIALFMVGFPRAHDAAVTLRSLRGD